MVVSLRMSVVPNREVAMKTDEIKDEWPHQEENDPEPDFSREDAAFERERARLLREHPGKFAVVHGDDIVGVFDTYNDATLGAYRLLGRVPLLICLIEERGEPAWISNIDVTHPSFKPLYVRTVG
jgi:hypothetical protein